MSRDSLVCAALRLEGLSWGDPQTRREYSLLLAPWDPEDVAVQMAAAQSSCALAVCAALLIAEVDGHLKNIPTVGKPGDFLRLPRRGLYHSIACLDQLAIERGLKQTVVYKQRPILQPGTIFQNGEGGAAHVGIVVGEDPDAYFTVEGGQIDPLNKRRPPQNCTAILGKKISLRQSGGKWMLGNKRLMWTMDGGELPCVPADHPRKGMPWEKIGVKP